MNNYNEQYGKYREMVEARLDTIIPKMGEGSFAPGRMPALLSESMRYSLLAGGKRLRPVMMLAATDMLGGDLEETLDMACALEMIHTYSLIHDDLPGMDNDTMRRGKPTNHIRFGQGQAILAGDGLLNYAFESMLENAMQYPQHAIRHIEAISEVARGAGVTGMIAGQVMDLKCEQTHFMDEPALKYIHDGKTAAMFRAALRSAAKLWQASERQMQALTDFAQAYGVLFQVSDDVLDVEGDCEELGKTTGKDAQSGKLTAVSVYGLGGAQAMCETLADEARKAMEQFGECGKFFCALVDETVGRRK